ncbi:MPN domain-containing protein [Mycena chlorophos]|uniref:MPN domain-containing protein n=1 Tax=Mycena chlorophos TaxID=658473 RepID=A0A8H6SEV6_MYCCL|nr:MPN domain-containing protein [Mycena chlorophos]
MAATSGTGTAFVALDDERDLPGVGMALLRGAAFIWLALSCINSRNRHASVNSPTCSQPQPPLPSMSKKDQIFQATAIVHPLVLLSVADHHARSVSRTSHKRVIGALLGQDNGKTINVANSFGIPFEEDDKDSKSWFLDHNYVQEMYDMFRKVNAKERLIGWYHTGPKLRASDQEINDLFKRFVARPLMVIVDVRPQTVGIPTDAYIAVDEIKDDGTETVKTFVHVPSAIEGEEAEEIGVEHLLRDIKDSTTTTLATRVAEQLASLRGLQSRLSDIQKYLVDVSQGTMPVDHKIVYHLQDAFNLLPDLSDRTLRDSFSANTNDALLVVYLSSLLRAVIALHALVDNKATVGRAEMEEGASSEKPKEKPAKEDKAAKE